MQYLVSVIDDKTGSATPTEMAAINAFNDRLEAEGHWVFVGGLALPSMATVIDNRGGAALFTDGPFLETKEYIAGPTRPGRNPHTTGQLGLAHVQRRDPLDDLLGLLRLLQHPGLPGLRRPAGGCPQEPQG